MMVSLSAHAQVCQLIMGYRTSARLPLIDKAPANDGFYQDLFRQATKKIGCRLVIKRQPKKRILRGLKNGSIDFYPGFSFSPERAKYALFIANGLTHGYGVLSRRGAAGISSWKDMEGKTALIAAGGSTDLLTQYDIRLASVNDLDLNKAAQLLLKHKADVYIYDASTIDYFLKQHPLLPLKSHPCCGQQHPMYLGFSRFSRYLNEIDNPSFDPTQPVSPANFPRQAKPGSVAARMAGALVELKASGFVDELVQKYY